MSRNLLLVILTLAVLVVLYAAYALLVGTPAVLRTAPPTLESLPKAEPNAAEVHVGNIVVPGGGRIVYRHYDERTGRPTDLFSCDDWTPMSSSSRELRVTNPGLAMLLPSGMVAYINADEGQLASDRVERSQFRPRQGHLSGNVRIIIDRQTGELRERRDQRPDDLITINVDELSFDLDRGELRTPTRVELAGEEFEIAGTGLALIWNQAENRVETLSINEGEQFTLYSPGGLFRAVGLEPNEPNEPATGDVAGAAPSAAPGEAAGVDTVSPVVRGVRPGRERRTAYACSLTGRIQAQQLHAGHEIGGLEAERVDLLFDMAGGTGRLVRTTTEPTSRPARDPNECLVVRWNGPLQLTPVEQADPDVRRLHFTASGTPVVLTRAKGVVRAARVEFHNETQRIWLDPPPGETVEFGMGANLAASASGVYVDRAARLVKLAGPVELRSHGGPGAGARGSRIRAGYWGELRLAADERPNVEATEAVLGFGQVETATFVGDVRVDLEEQALTAHQLDVRFRPRAPEAEENQSLENSLDTAVARGSVRLAGESGRLDCGQLELHFATTPEGALYPRKMHARGAARLVRGESAGWRARLTKGFAPLTGGRPERARVRGDEIIAELAPPAAPASPEAPAPDFVVRTLDVIGRAALRDLDNRVTAAGELISATFAGENELVTSTVRGSADAPGRVHAAPYMIHGPQIDLNQPEQTVTVDGPSRLQFAARRSLQGEQRRRAAPVIVTAARRLHIDGRENLVEFEGDVRARSQDEQLAAERMELVLEDAAEAAAGARDELSWRQMLSVLGVAPVVLRDLGDGLDALNARPARRGAELALRPAERIRKEPLSLNAQDALITSESYEAGAGQPVVHASISAPRLEIDIPNRQIVTLGVTQLLMTDRRGVAAEAPARDVLGVPTALVTRGPSQTAMQCAGKMTYTLGPDGPGRRDTVVFEQDVLFVHRAGKDMVNLRETLGELAANPAAVESLKSRRAALECERLECWFTADPQRGAAARGGALTRMPMQLTSMLARTDVYLRDQEGARIREVYADRIEFDRADGRIDVRGSAQAEARIYLEDLDQKKFAAPYVGQHLVVNLNDGTVKTGRMMGTAP